MHPSGVAKSSTSYWYFGWGKGWNVTSAEWQVTLCDPIWHVNCSSGVAGDFFSELLYPCYSVSPCYFTLTVPPCASVQVWFQNRRAKEKRLKKDAGRQRWSPYFRPMRPDRAQTDSDDRNSLDDQTNVQLDSFGSKSHHGRKSWGTGGDVFPRIWTGGR